MKTTTWRTSPDTSFARQREKRLDNRHRKSLPLLQPGLGPFGAGGSRDTAWYHYDGAQEHIGERHPGTAGSATTARRLDVDRRDLP
jgi:hypothetical protein